MSGSEICLLNDSFPPVIDGVANTVVNYAKIIRENVGDVCVVTPEYPGADDTGFDFPVIRYPSINLVDRIGYTAGNPFDFPTLLRLKNRNIGLLHSHCPVMSNMIARTLRDSMNVPFILTYHTNYDMDISNLIRLKTIQAGAVRALVDSVSACDELWVVSEGAGKNLKNLGYNGQYVVMSNGVDIPRGRLDSDFVEKTVSGYDLPDGVPLFIFVGRLMWYKGIRLIVDALAALRSNKIDFRMVFVGGGGDEPEIKQYVERLKLNDRVFFIGPINDRNALRAWYCRSDLMLFPSTFDTNGLVVREAAACSLGSVLVKGSCAAEGVRDGIDGLLIEKNAASLAVCLARIIDSPDRMRKIGENASAYLYISWNDSVKKAVDRYQVVKDNFRSGKYKKHKKLTDDIFTVTGDLLQLYAEAEDHKKRIEQKIERLF